MVDGLETADVLIVVEEDRAVIVNKILILVGSPDESCI
jgi:hypothetical protein